jgi:DNA-binding transcriptional LysR family regulator
LLLRRYPNRVGGTGGGRSASSVETAVAGWLGGGSPDRRHLHLGGVGNLLPTLITGPSREILPSSERETEPITERLGITTLPCFVGDADPLLVRVPGTDLHLYGTIWLLTQGETRKTKRVRLFTEFMPRRLTAYGPLLAGLSISRD